MRGGRSRREGRTGEREVTRDGLVRGGVRGQRHAVDKGRDVGKVAGGHGPDVDGNATRRARSAGCEVGVAGPQHGVSDVVGRQRNTIDRLRRGSRGNRSAARSGLEAENNGLFDVRARQDAVGYARGAREIDFRQIAADGVVQSRKIALDMAFVDGDVLGNVVGQVTDGKTSALGLGTILA